MGHLPATVTSEFASQALTALLARCCPEPMTGRNPGGALVPAGVGLASRKKHPRKKNATMAKP
jgi:hypothetical protein